MVGWYSTVYRSACELARMSDFSEYMPPVRGAVILHGPKGIAMFRSLLALDFGLQIIFALLKAMSEIFELPLPETTAVLKEEFDQLHAHPVNPSEVERV